MRSLSVTSGLTASQAAAVTSSGVMRSSGGGGGAVSASPRGSEPERGRRTIATAAVYGGGAQRGLRPNELEALSLVRGWSAMRRKVS